MIPPLTRSADSRPPIDADPDDVPEFDGLPAFRSRRAYVVAQPLKPDTKEKLREDLARRSEDGGWPMFLDDEAEQEANAFGLTVVEWVVGFGLGAILVGFGIWLGVVLA